MKIRPELVLDPDTNELNYLILRADGMDDITIDANVSGEVHEFTNQFKTGGSGIDMG